MSPELIFILVVLALLCIVFGVSGSTRSGDGNFTREVASQGNGENADDYRERRM
jgi:hypothetical protein